VTRDKSPGLNIVIVERGKLKFSGIVRNGLFSIDSWVSSKFGGGSWELEA